mmetsp:Transcript_61530/g.75449  ORF Transcript_61530/g.75449 Transcript_61530/m.75449 type:complete len:208 (+) Transcript_61530:63-686(+)
MESPYKLKYRLSNDEFKYIDYSDLTITGTDNDTYITDTSVDDNIVLNLPPNFVGQINDDNKINEQKNDDISINNDSGYVTDEEFINELLNDISIAKYTPSSFMSSMSKDKFSIHKPKLKYRYAINHANDLRLYDSSDNSQVSQVSQSSQLGYLTISDSKKEHSKIPELQFAFQQNLEKYLMKPPLESEDESDEEFINNLANDISNDE